MNKALSVGVEFIGDVHFDDSPLFSNVHLKLPAGQWTCLLGPSGSGKSTILKLLAGLPIGGTFTGSMVTRDGPSLEGRIAYMAQSDLLFPWLNVKQNIMLGNRLRGEQANRVRAEELIQQVQLKDHSHKKPHELSGGMRQRVALARTLMEDTPMVLLDEPFSALDAKTRSDMQEMAFEALKDKTVLLVSHDPAEAVRLAHQLYVLSNTRAYLYQLEVSQPIRAIDDPGTLQAQAKLLLMLKHDQDEA